MIRLIQILLMASALVLGLTTGTAFNGQSILALILLGAVLYLGHRFGDRPNAAE